MLQTKKQDQWRYSSSSLLFPAPLQVRLELLLKLAQQHLPEEVILIEEGYEEPVSGDSDYSHDEDSLHYEGRLVMYLKEYWFLMSEVRWQLDWPLTSELRWLKYWPLIGCGGDYQSLE